MFQLLKQREGGCRETPGTALRNEASGEVIFVPPQDRNEIIALMRDLEDYVNGEGRDTLDPLIRMALIHHRSVTTWGRECEAWGGVRDVGD